jgi:pimeloyl-ACP methyl ester carboxylesterase
MPTLNLPGRRDPTSWRLRGRLGQWIPRVRIVVLEESGHFMHLDEPGKFPAAVRALPRSPP